MGDKGRCRLKMGLGAVLALLGMTALAYVRWYSNQPFIGYETYAASINGALNVSTGYTLYALARVALLPLVVVAGTFIAFAIRDRRETAGKKREGSE